MLGPTILIQQSPSQKVTFFSAQNQLCLSEFNHPLPNSDHCLHKFKHCLRWPNSIIACLNSSWLLESITHQCSQFKFKCCLPKLNHYVPEISCFLPELTCHLSESKQALNLPKLNRCLLKFKYCLPQFNHCLPKVHCFLPQYNHF